MLIFLILPNYTIIFFYFMLLYLFRGDTMIQIFDIKKSRKSLTKKDSINDLKEYSDEASIQKYDIFKKYNR